MYNKDLFSLEGKPAVVTGAGSGIGWRVARFLANAGADVVVADWVAESGERVAAELNDAGHRAVAAPVDVSDQRQVRQMFKTWVDNFGAPYVLANCAAIFPMERLADITTESWGRVHNIDLRGVFYCLQQGARLMREAGKGGRIINISSLDAQHPAMIGLVHYGAAKAGVHGLTIHAALELAPDRTTVNAIMPGNTATGGAMTAKPVVPIEQVMADAERQNIMNRQGLSEDLAGAVLFLASQASANITGTRMNRPKYPKFPRKPRKRPAFDSLRALRKVKTGADFVPDYPLRHPFPDEPA